MTTYRFTYGYPKFYPAVQDAEGKSLMAMPGEVYELAVVPDDGSWVLAEQTPEVPPAGPEPAPEPVQPEPEPVPVPVAPEPAPAPVAPAEPVVVVNMPVAATATQARPFVFPGFTSPPVRA